MSKPISTSFLASIEVAKQLDDMLGYNGLVDYQACCRPGHDWSLGFPIITTIFLLRAINTYIGFYFYQFTSRLSFIGSSKWRSKGELIVVTLIYARIGKCHSLLGLLSWWAVP
jgi:hypothetical protein